MPLDNFRFITARQIFRQAAWAFVSGGLWFKSKQQDTTKYFSQIVTTKFVQRHSPQVTLQTLSVDTDLRFTFHFRAGQNF